MDKPKVSILCLAYNHEKYIKQALDSFLNQKTNFNFEILIHDDASTDKTTQIIKEYQKKYPKIIKPIFQKENQYSKKIYGMLNKYLLPHALGEYIALCEGDDYWYHPNKLQIAIDTLEKNTDCLMFCHNSYVKRSDTKKLEELLVDENIKFENNKFSLTNSIYTHLSARVFRNIKGLPPGDLPQYHFLLSKGLCYYDNKPMSVYRYNQKGVWSSLSDIEQQKENIKMYYLLNIFLNKKYDDYYLTLAPPEFVVYHDNFNKNLSWILYLISINFVFSDIFNYKTKFVNFSKKEIFLWKFLIFIENKTKFTHLIKDKISNNQISKTEFYKVINSLNLNIFYKFIYKLLLKK